MSLLELKQQISRLSQRDRRELQAYLVRLRHQTPASRRAVARKIRAMKRGKATSLEAFEDSAVGAFEVKSACEPEQPLENFESSEAAAWLRLVRNATKNSRPMTDEERRAVDDFFLSEFDDDDQGSRQLAKS